MRTAIWDKVEQQNAYILEQYGHTEYKQSLEKILSHMLKEGPNGDPPERIARHIPLFSSPLSLTTKPLVKTCKLIWGRAM